MVVGDCTQASVRQGWRRREVGRAAKTPAQANQLENWKKDKGLKAGAAHCLYSKHDSAVLRSTDDSALLRLDLQARAWVGWYRLDFTSFICNDGFDLKKAASTDKLRFGDTQQTL